jgi:hypothetical protein
MGHGTRSAFSLAAVAGDFLEAEEFPGDGIKRQ